MKDSKRINCTKCEFYYITWDKNKSRGCRAFGFKSNIMPSIIVYKSSGKKCLKFQLKNK